eukprot:TRINITY_DN5171_c0_g1_i20.p1 TRINITY_DN5171_c0_g1~~TRINITY_DN5171_c0_g1_i20.p1  ORF type:complete len:162 (+),score=26.77 TRINITY_DN5171_c0_g1_i20:106-591(+)
MTERSSFDHLQKHYDMVKHRSPNCFVIFVGSKYDLIEEKFDCRSVSFEETFSFASKKGCKNVETSAKLNTNIDRVFDIIGENFFPLPQDPAPCVPAPTPCVPAPTPCVPTPAPCVPAPIVPPLQISGSPVLSRSGLCTNHTPNQVEESCCSQGPCLHDERL